MASIVKRKSKYSVVYNIVDENGVKPPEMGNLRFSGRSEKAKGTD